MFQGLLQNRYQILQVLNRGGMATIYLALDKRLKCQVVVKEITFYEKVEPAGVNLLANAFEQEAQLLASLNHPAIPKSFDYFIENGHHYLVMEFVGGVDLERLVRRSNTGFDLEQLQDWTLQLLDVLEYLHSQNPFVVHRDIKPSNIKVNAKNQIRLLDFGIAKIYKSDICSSDSINFATLEYAPLEQSLKASASIRNSLMAINREKTLEILRTQSSPQSDIFSLGATLYRLVTGKLPVDAHTRALSIWLGKPDPLPAVSYFNKAIPADFESAIMQSLSLFPSQRPQSVSSLRQQIFGQKKTRFQPTPNQSIQAATNGLFQPHFGAFLQQISDLKRKITSLENELRELKEGYANPVAKITLIGFVLTLF